MTLRHRIRNTVLFNTGLFLVPLVCYNASHMIMLWGAYRGWWPLYVTM